MFYNNSVFRLENFQTLSLFNFYSSKFYLLKESKLVISRQPVFFNILALKSADYFFTH